MVAHRPAPTIEQGVGVLLTAPREKLLAEMESLDRVVRLPGSAWAAADTGSDARLRLAEAAHASYRALPGGCARPDHTARRVII